MQFLKPGTEIINQCLGEGYSSRQITSIYGPAASGKTTCCLLAAIECAQNNLKTIYIDTENGFNPRRVNQLVSNPGKVLDNLLLMKASSFEDQLRNINQSIELARSEKVKLVIVDTIGSHYRVEIKKDFQKTNDLMIEQFRLLTHIARDFNKIVIITNQVYQSITKNSIVPVSGDIIKNFSDVMILLDKTDSKRYLQQIKPGQDERWEFEIREKGIFLV